jgi:hypothetical protein
MHMLLVTYANLLQQHGQLPTGSGMAGSSSQSDRPRRGKSTVLAADSARGASGSSSSSRKHNSIASSSSGHTSGQQHPVAAAQTPLPVTTGLPTDLAQALTAWHQVQGQWDRLPASHKQLLQLLGISPQAVLWLAAIMPKTKSAGALGLAAALGTPEVQLTAVLAEHNLKAQQRRRGAATIVPLPTPSHCWLWNPHNVGMPEARRHGYPQFPAVLELEQQLKQWDDTPLPELMQLVLLYWMVHAELSDKKFIRLSTSVIHDIECFVGRLVEARLKADAPAQQQSAQAGCSSGWGPVLSPPLQEELLLLTLQLMQRAQHMRAAAGSSTSVPASSDPQQQVSSTAVEEPSRYLAPVRAGIHVLQRLSFGVQISRPLQAAGITSAPAAAAAAAGATTAPGGALAATHPSAFVPYTAAFQQMAGTVFGVFEEHLRDQHKHRGSEYVRNSAVDIYWSLEDPPRYGPLIEAQLLLRLAQGGNAEQQVAFCNLLVTLLKVMDSLKPDRYDWHGSVAGCRSVVAAYGVKMLRSVKHSSEAAAAGTAVSGAASCSIDGGSSSGGNSGVQAGSSSITPSGSSSSSKASPAQWLLLLSRCCLTWADQLAQEGAKCPWLLSMAQAVTGALGEGSSISAELTAAGYDMGAVLQGFEAIAACYPGVLRAAEPGDAAGKFGQLVDALQAAGNASSVFAVPHCCNNPLCNELSGPSELSLLSGTSCICGGCRVARYCGRGCQKAHWKQHRAVCKVLQGTSVHHF